MFQAFTLLNPLDTLLHENLFHALACERTLHTCTFFVKYAYTLS